MNYSKSFAAIVATVLSVVVAALTDGSISTTEWINVAVAGVGAAAVFAAPNVPHAPVTKSVLAVLTAVLTLAVTLISGGVTVSEWIQLGLAALGALGVYRIPNRTTKAPSGPLIS